MTADQQDSAVLAEQLATLNAGLKALNSGLSDGRDFVARDGTYNGRLRARQLVSSDH
jgi:hypothetical protein